MTDSIYTTMIQAVNIPSGMLMYELGNVAPYYKYNTDHVVPSGLCDKDPLADIDRLVLMEFQERILKELEEKAEVVWKGEVFSRPSSWDYPLYLVPGFLYKTMT